MAIFEVLNNQQSYFNRYFRRNEGSTDYATIPEITLSGDFVIEFDALWSENTLNRVLIGDSHTSAYYFAVNEVDFEVWISGVKHEFPHNASSNSKNVFHSIKYVLSGAVLELFVDSVSLGTNTITPYVGTNSFRLYSSNSISNANLNGILANLKIYDAGTLVRDYPLDDNSNILANRAASLGQELVVNGDFSDGIAGWSSYNSVSSVSNGVLTVDDSGDAGTNSGVFKSVELIEGVDYVLSYDLISVTTGIFIGLNGTSSGVGSWLIANDARTGVREMIFTAANNSNLLVAVGGTGSLELESISIRRADGYGTIINGNADDWGLFDKQADGDWLGQELLFNGDFSQGASGWSGTVDTTVFADNKLYYNGTTNNVIYQNSISNTGVYLVTADIESFTRNASTPRPQFQVINNNGYQPITSGVAGLGSIYYDVSDASNPNSYFELGQFGSGAEFVVNSFSVKEVLKNA